MVIVNDLSFYSYKPNAVFISRTEIALFTIDDSNYPYAASQRYDEMLRTTDFLVYPLISYRNIAHNGSGMLQDMNRNYEFA